MLAHYEPLGPRVSLHAAIRWATVPADAVVSMLPSGATLLDYGCGHGILSIAAALADPTRTITGVDIDASKVRAASAAAVSAGVDDRTTFTTIPTEWQPPPASFECVMCADVLYLLGRRRALETVRVLLEALTPGGTLVIKEMSQTPRWKTAIDRCQEAWSVNVLAMTQGAQVDPVSVEDIAAELVGLGAAPTVHRLDRRRLHPHAALTTGRAGPASPEQGSRRHA